MKKKDIIVATLVFALTFIGCKENNSVVAADDSFQSIEMQNIEDAIGQLPVTDLSNAEKEGLVFCYYFVIF